MRSIKGYHLLAVSAGVLTAAIGLGVFASGVGSNAHRSDTAATNLVKGAVASADSSHLQNRGGTTTTIAPATTTTVPATTTTTTTPPPTTTAPAKRTVVSPVAPKIVAARPISTPTPTTTTTAPVASPSAPSQVVTANSADPSGVGPPGALAGYTQIYVNDFTGTSMPAGWTQYTGQPGGDAGAEWSSSQDVVAGGMLQLDAANVNGQWVTGGACLCSVSQTYGAYFVRSRITGPGPTAVELLWPSSNSWPPEIDFNETQGESDQTNSNVHFGSSNNVDTKTLSIDMTQWHTWGVIWTPSSITYTVDGQVWASVTVSSEIPDVPMFLAIQQQTWCSSGFACPSTPESLDVDWVAVYSPG